ncbi:MAG: S8 family serine peptidase, partial [Bacteroidia bacterium]|nr:S8 family serine peptidase [Bacteroidia bacterium]
TNMSYGYDGIIYAANAGAHIINCSFGGSEFSRFGLDAVMYATYNKNALVVAAGGNVLGDTTFYPAGFSEVLAVASLDYQDVIQTSYGCHIDISTPSGGVGLLRPNQYQNTAIGVASSWAAPLVSGAAALVKAHFPNYTALQIAEKLRVAANAEIYQVNNGLNYENKLGKGRLDMYQALTLESPSVRVSGLNFEDNNDNIPTAGDTVLLKIQLTNYLLATTQLSVLLEVHSPFVEILNSRNLIGALQTQEEKVVTFRIYLRPNIPQNFKAYFTLSYEDPNLEYKAKECFPVLLNITFVNISNEKIATTVNSVGNFGFNDVGVNSQGIGFTFLGKNQLYLGGFVAGTSPNTTVDNLINQTGRPQRDFRPLQPLLFQRPGRIANEEVIAYFDDGGAGQNRIPIRIKNQASIFSGVGKDQFVLMEYTLFNPSPRTISNLYAGIFADWDIGEEATNDNTNFIAEENLAYAYDNENNTPILGIKALQPQAAVHASGQMNTYSNYTKTAKFRNISSGQNNANIEDTDIIQYLATGPYEIPAQDSITLRFALLAGHTLEDIKQQGKIAEKIYCDFTQAGIYSINLGKDTTSCTPIFLGGKIAQAVHYQWSEGSMAPQLWVWESGKYSLTVYDSKGCQLSDTIEVNIVPFKAEFKVSDTLLIPPQDLLTVKDTTPGAISWFWDFGDGNTATTPVAEHRYAQDGTYTLTLIVSNGTCYDTVQKIIRRQTPTSMLVNNFTSSLILFPNPIIRNNKFSIQGLLTNEKATIMLQDLAGKIIAQWQEKEISSGYLELQIPQLPQGIYYLCIQSSLRNQTLKLLIGTNVDD